MLLTQLLFIPHHVKHVDMIAFRISITKLLYFLPYKILKFCKRTCLTCTCMNRQNTTAANTAYQAKARQHRLSHLLDVHDRLIFSRGVRGAFQLVLPVHMQQLLML